MKNNNKLKRLMVLALCLFLFLAPVVAFADNGSTTVYITRTGEKYHTSGCSYLKSSIPISLEDAVDAGYTRCSRCHPPSLDKTSTPAPTIRVQSTPRPTARVQTTPRPTATPNYAKAAAQSPEGGGDSVRWIISTVVLAILSALSFANASDQKRARREMEMQRYLQNKENSRLDSENRKLLGEVSRLKEKNHELSEALNKLRAKDFVEK